MLLYRIRRKDTQQYFLGLRHPHSQEHGKEGWSPTGAFYRDIDTITCWLKVLCSDWRTSRFASAWPSFTARKLSQCLIGYDPSRLSLYEVVVSDVALLDEKVINPEELIKP